LLPVVNSSAITLCAPLFFKGAAVARYVHGGKMNVQIEK